METIPFNPPDKRNIGINITNVIFEQQPFPMSTIQSFAGVGIYAIYYKGDLDIYNKISAANKKGFTQPIYVGKAVPVVDGFGNHDPGKGRYKQQVSAWDTIHPGRKWAEKLQKGKTKEEIIDQINDFLQQRYNHVDE